MPPPNQIMQRIIGWFQIILLFSLTVILGILMSGYYSWRIWVTKQSTNWPTTTGEIITATLQETHYKGPAYSPSIRYKYHVNGRFYFNDAITLAHTDPTNLENAQAKIAHYRPGKTVNVFYDQASPEIACLEPGYVPWENYIPIIMGPLFVIAGVILFEVKSPSIRLFIKKRTNKL